MSSTTGSAFLKDVFTAAAEYGAVRVRYSDTLGIMNPSTVGNTIGFLAADLQVPFDFHGHNDFGLATANALSAWEHGARVISCSLPGLGERAGNTSLEEFVAVRHCMKDEAGSIDFTLLRELCIMISAWFGRLLPDSKPVIGKNIFHHESGIHVDGILKEPKTYEHFGPAVPGSTRQSVPVKHSGRKAIGHLARQRGDDIIDEQIEGSLKFIRRIMAGKRGADAQSLLDGYLRQHGKRGKT